MPQFEKVAQTRFKSKGAIIAEQILEQIKSGEYQAGSKLPPERVIAEQMGVSRPSVREAVSALHIVGVLESRPGDGTYISETLAIDDLILRVQNILEEVGFHNVQFRFRAHFFSFVCTYFPTRRFRHLRERLMTLDYGLFRCIPNGASMIGSAMRRE